jgi:hypothetical protein
VAQALSGPFLIAALTLCVAAVAKLRRPAPAAAALKALDLPGSETLIRLLAAAELALGLTAVVKPGVAPGAALAALYAAFAVVALALHHRGAACGCFGDRAAPASPMQTAISAALAAVCAVAAGSDVHGVAWIFGRSPALAAPLIIGITGAVFATAVAYSELPAAWGAWGGR